MRLSITTVATIAVLGSLTSLSVSEAHAQFRGFWLDIGEFHNVYSEGGARQEGAPGIPEGYNFPAIVRQSGHGVAQGLWIGLKNWTNERGEQFPYYVSRIGPREPGIEFTDPIDTRIIARYEDTEVFVDGGLAFDKLAVVDEVDPSIPADRMLVNQFNMNVGVSVTRTAYAYVNQFHDNFHIIEYEYCNTGNIDLDDDIELPGQTLNDTYFYHMHRWRNAGNASWYGSDGHAWGKFNMIDVVGDGHAEYGVDFTAFYVWFGYDPGVTEFSNIGAPHFQSRPDWGVTGQDTVGRLGGHTFIGRAQLHIDNSPNDETYSPCTEVHSRTDPAFQTCQPHTIGWMDQDEPLASVNESHQNYYELGILTRENPSVFPGGSSRMFPHYAERVEPTGEFWNPSKDASSGHGSVAQGGYAPTEAIGPYQMAFGDCIYQSVVEGIDGLSYDASVNVGRTYKRGGFQTRENLLISYDANGDGQILDRPFNYDIIGLPLYQGNGCTTCTERGSERLTKNQWVMTSRDSLFQTFFRARDLYEASNRFTVYPIPEAPHAPVGFTIDGRPDAIELAWVPNSGGPAIDHWEIYRTTNFPENLLAAGGSYRTVSGPTGERLVTGYECIAGCAGTPDLPVGTTNFDDRTAGRGVDYFYYIIGVGAPQPNDPLAINGTPGGMPMTSSRYLTQSYLPTNLKRAPYNTVLPEAERSVRDARVVPNPVNLGSLSSVRFDQEDRLFFYNIPPICTIKIFTEIGELIQTIEHTNGSGDELWNLTTASRQLLVSGIYIAVIEDAANGEQAILKFTVIR